MENDKASGDADIGSTPGHTSAVVTPTMEHSVLTDLTEVVVATDKAAARCNEAGWYWLGSIVGQGDETKGEATAQALAKFRGIHFLKPYGDAVQNIHHDLSLTHFIIFRIISK